MQSKFITAVALSTLLSQVMGHGVVTSITGANGVTMPGLSIIDGTPRDCSTNRCGAQADTAIIRNNGPPLGKTQGAGAVDAETAVATFMGNGANAARRLRRGILDNLKGALGGGGAGAAGNAAGTKTAAGAKEDMVGKTAGEGASSGLPTVGADGIISMTFHQVNQDGAGPLTATIDPSSGGKDASAFVPATMVKDVPGLGVGGLSLATNEDFPIQVQMPAGMKCTGTVAGVSGVCVVQVKNGAAAGPFGGSAVFTQDDAAPAAAPVGKNATAEAAKF